MVPGLKSHVVTFTAPGRVEVQEEAVIDPSPGRVLVRTRASAISAGTELLVYRGQAPADMATDESIAALGGNLEFPLQYGYAAAGEIAKVGVGADPELLGRRVFAFNPHASLFEAEPETMLAVPDGVSFEDAAMLPSMETAVNLVMDGLPIVGEAALVIGQGVIGLLTTALLARMPLSALVTLDALPGRRETSQRLGATMALDPAAPDSMEAVRAALGNDGADLTFELSGRPEALNIALAATGFAGRIVIGSWYGTKSAPIDLGGRFHRSRIRLISSQVTTIAPELAGRWTKERRFRAAWEMIRQVEPSRLVTHRFPVARAGEAYRLLDESPQDALQVLLTYDD